MFGCRPIGSGRIEVERLQNEFVRIALEWRKSRDQFRHAIDSLELERPSSNHQNGRSVCRLPRGNCLSDESLTRSRKMPLSLMPRTIAHRERARSVRPGSIPAGHGLLSRHLHDRLAALPLRTASRRATDPVHTSGTSSMRCLGGCFSAALGTVLKASTTVILYPMNPMTAPVAIPQTRAHILQDCPRYEPACPLSWEPQKRSQHSSGAAGPSRRQAHQGPPAQRRRRWHGRRRARQTTALGETPTRSARWHALMMKIPRRRQHPLPGGAPYNTPRPHAVDRSAPRGASSG